jgi:DNA-binding transcriptional LysR family regulator
MSALLHQIHFQADEMPECWACRRFELKKSWNQCELNSPMSESLDSRQLEAFVALAKTGSYTETAKQLYVTHSAISHSMRALESQVGCRLFSKMRKKTILTQAGETLLVHASRVLEEMRLARLTLRQLNKWGSKHLRLMVEPAFCDAILPPVLLKFYREFPQFIVHVEVNGCGDPANVLENNRADILLAEKPQAGDQVEFIPLLADRFVFVVNSAHPLALRNNVTRTELSKQPCLLLGGSSHGRKRLDDFLSQRDLALNIIGEFESVDTVKAMVRQSPVMGFLPGWVVAEEIKKRALIALPPGRKPFEQTWGIVHSGTRHLNHAESTFLKFCRQRVAELD